MVFLFSNGIASKTYGVAGNFNWQSLSALLILAKDYLEQNPNEQMHKKRKKVSFRSNNRHANSIDGMHILIDIRFDQIESDTHFLDNEPICCLHFTHKSQTIRYETHNDLLITHQF